MAEAALFQQSFGKTYLGNAGHAKLLPEFSHMNVEFPEIEVWCVRCGDPTYFNDDGWMIPTDRWYCDDCFSGWLRGVDPNSLEQWDLTDQ